MTDNPKGLDPDNPVNRLLGHRFGEPGGANPDQSKTQNRPWSVRDGIRRIAAHEFDISEGAPPIPDQIKKLFKGKMTGAQIAAATKWAQSMKNWKAMENLTVDIDGKHIEKKVEAKVGYAELVAGSLEQEKDQSFVTGEDDGTTSEE